jgi:hypothetical protein
MGRCFDAAFELVDVNDVKPVAMARIRCRPKNAAKCRSQGEPSDAAHSVDANSHGVFLFRSCLAATFKG